MPFIDVRSSGPVSESAEREVKAALGRAISLIPGKSEGSLMIQFTDNCRLWFGGEQNGPIVMVNVMLYESADPAHYEKFQNAVIPMLEEKLGAGQVYLKFEEVPHWYWN